MTEPEEKPMADNYTKDDERDGKFIYTKQWDISAADYAAYEEELARARPVDPNEPFYEGWGIWKRLTNKTSPVG
jgi:hypothetical protein